MHSFRILPALLVAMVLPSPPPAAACTAFLLRAHGEVRMGKSYDWHTADGIALQNPRGLAKRALLLQRDAKPLSWVSRYSSLTFNQYGREFPLGGMNETGLAIEILWLSSSRYPKGGPGKPAVNELQWIQYHLDTSATVAELVRAAGRVRILRAYARVHYLACDAGGACATVEMLGGRLVVHQGRSLPVPVLTNDTYSGSLAFLRRHRGFGGTRALPGGASSLARFVRAARGVRRFARTGGRGSAETAAFRLLASVRSGGYSKWHIVYDLRRRQVAFRPAAGGPVQRFAFSARHHSCRTPVRGRDLMGTVAPALRGTWGRYTTALNRRLVTRTFARLGRGLPTALIAGVARYPGLALRCVRP